MAMEAPTENTAPVAGSTKGEYTFPNGVASITVCTKNGDTDVGAHVYFRFYDSSAELTEESTASSSLYDVALFSDGNKTWTGKAEWVGMELIKKVSVYVETGGDVDGVYIAGGRAGY